MDAGRAASHAADVWSFATHRCSREQEGLWLLEQARAVRSANNLPVGLLLTGALDVQMLGRALDALVTRHAALRTVLSPAGDRARRREYPASAIGAPRLELLRADDPGEAERLVADRSRAPLDPTSWPPYRFAVVRRSPEQHLLLLVFHHCVFDGTSAELALLELARILTALLAGEPPGRDPALPPYGRYVAAEDVAVADLEERAAAYWEPALAAVEDSLRIPTASRAAGGHGECVEFEIDGDLRARLAALSDTHGASLFTALLAVLQVLQYRYAGGADGGVATAVAMDARPRDMREAIGMFANEAPLLSSPTSQMPFSEFLHHVRDGTRGLFALRRFPFTEALGRYGRPGSREAGAQVGVTYLRSGRRETSIPGLAVEPLGLLPNHGSRRPLMLWLFDRPSQLSARLDYDPRLISAEMANRLARHYSRLVASIVDSPDDALGRLELLTRTERRQILGEWSAGETARRDDLTVPAVVEQQVRRTPLARAVELGERSVTYAELNARANRLAHHLRELGAHADAPIAVCMERSVDLVVALLAVLKAGAAYVPLDPGYPRERLRLMLERARAPILISHEPVSTQLPETRGEVVLLDRDAAAIARRPAHDPRPAARPSNLAYVIYTSGSTGMPKGVAMPHRALVNLLEWQRGNFVRTRAARTLQFASASFDVAFQDIFSTLATGGCVVLVTEELRRDFQALARLVDEARIERLFMPSPALNELARHLARRPVAADSVDAITAGERLEVTPQIRELWRRRPGWTLTNQYGPTETHVVTAHRLAADAGAWPALPPIGRPIANVRVYVLDRELRPVPPGVPGELHVAGTCLARGYLHDPKVTAERFIADPFGPEGSRLYRTGDMVRWRSGGVLEFLGRLDHQVKLRGLRVELGEIEAVLVQHPGVRAAAVVADADSPRLIAYVVPEGEAADLAAHARRLLPDYMVPAVFVPLPELPLTPNGKLDRRALPVPDEAEGSCEQYVSPRSRTEEVLAEVWAETLGLARVGVEDDFFALGGHSLLAGELVARARERLGRDIAMRTLFSGPTVAQMAAAVDHGGQDEWPDSTAARRPLAEVLSDE